MLKRGFKEMLAEAKAVIETVSVQDLPYHIEDGEAVLVDVREAVERESEGVIPGSVHASRGLLEFMIDPEGMNPPVRVSNTDGTDILPVFSPDGNSLAWSTTRTPGGASQIHMGNWNHQRALELLGLD